MNENIRRRSTMLCACIFMVQEAGAFICFGLSAFLQFYYFFFSIVWLWYVVWFNAIKNNCTNQGLSHPQLTKSMHPFANNNGLWWNARNWWRLSVVGSLLSAIVTIRLVIKCSWQNIVKTVANKADWDFLEWKRLFSKPELVHAEAETCHDSQGSQEGRLRFNWKPWLSLNFVPDNKIECGDASVPGVCRKECVTLFYIPGMTSK